MLGLMQDRPLLLSDVFRRAERLFADKKIITLTPAGEGTAHRSITTAQWARRVRQLAAALDGLGLSSHACIGTLGVNSQLHLEAYFAIPLTGRVLHTVNTRLSPGDVRYVVDHAGDEALLIDRQFLANAWPLAESLPAVRHWVVMEDGTDDPLPDDPRIVRYETLIDSYAPREDNFVIDDENRASGLCYTSGTTGRPKGVAYSHRSTVLHTLGLLGADSLAVSEHDVIMPIVPMFHVHAWGLPYANALAGGTLVLPGRATSPAEILAAIAKYRVTLTAAATTVWNLAEPHLDEYDLSSLRMVLAGGSAAPRTLSESWRLRAGTPITHSWGMTEISPLAVLGRLRPEDDGLGDDAAAKKRALQGRPVALVDLRISSNGEDLPWDGEAVGEVEVSGPWVASGYLGHNDEASFTADGWLRTGDLASITPEGFLCVVDRIKDIIKSGGEWISSVELENAIITHPEVLEAAVVGRPDERWAERPVAYVVVNSDAQLETSDILAHLRPLVAKWWLPDDIIFVPSLPKTGSGKVVKSELRNLFEHTPPLP
jgi:fatty-acyl-CoA synthase